MNSTLQVVLITIVSVHLLNFIVLLLDEQSGWKYEDYAKQFCCLSASLLAFLFLVLPYRIAMKVRTMKARARENKPNYAVRKMLTGSKWPVHQWQYIAVSVSYELAFESIKKDIVNMLKDKPNDFGRFRREYDDIYMVGEDDGYAIRYEIVEGYGTGRN